MIIIILIIAVLLFSYCMIFQKTGLWRNITIGLSFTLMAGSILTISLNDNQHFGMRQTVTTQTISLAPMHQLLFRQIGHSTAKSYLYATAVEPHKTHHTAVNNHTEILVQRQTNSQAKLHIKTTWWQYRNSFWGLLFGIGGENHQLANQQYLFSIPQNWQLHALPGNHYSKDSQ